MILKVFFFLNIFYFLITGCGNVSNLKDKIVLNGQYLIDTKRIEGITYSCEDNITGKTLKDGNFTYVKNQSGICKFWINDILLTAVDTDKLGDNGIVNPDEKSRKMLYSLDNDANASNGIKILPEVVTALNGKLKNIPNTDAELVAMVGYLSDVSEYHGRVFLDTPVSFGVKIIGYKSDKRYLYGETVALDANITIPHPYITYNWVVDNNTFSTPKITIDDFSEGVHNIKLTVKDTINNIIAEDSVVIIVSDYFVTIKPVKKVYKKDENVTLEANVTGIVSSLGYVWSDKHTAWKDDKSEGNLKTSDDLSSFTTEKLTRLFSIGHHKVTVNVSANRSNKSATFDFDVIDDSDFNRTLYKSKDRVVVHKNLMWVDQPVNQTAVDGKPKCAKIHSASDTNNTLKYEEFENGKIFCQEMIFFGKNDWRTPTPSEVKEYINDSLKANFLSVYDAACARLLVITDPSHPDENNSYATVTTRYSSLPAHDSGLIPSIGLRCVRDNN
jgi:hypothetical protein